MKYNFQIYLIFIAFIACHICFGQENQYRFKRPIQEVSDVWHSIALPDSLFEKLQPGLSDLRILGLNSNHDTIEVPYILNILKSEINKKEVEFDLLNQSKKDNKYIFVLEIPTKEEINRISLTFQEKNYDWKISLEGGQKTDDWYSILDDYRIISLKNQLTDYSFNTLVFPKSLYRYYKITIDAGTRPHLISASVEQEEIVPGVYKSYNIRSIERKEDKKLKQTIIDLSLPYSVPVSKLTLTVNDSIDYYRPFNIQYLSDSSQSPKGWKYFYRTAYKGVLSSLEQNKFVFPHTIAAKWRIIINNQDNTPLKYGKIEIKGNVHELIARFSEPAEYYLIYGNASALPPAYDIGKFREKIPHNLVKLEPGAEQLHFQDKIVQVNPLFQKQIWLWSIMGIIIIILGTYSLKMIRRV